MKNNKILMFVCITCGEKRLTIFESLKFYFHRRSIISNVYKNYMVYFFDMNTWLVNNFCQNQCNSKKLRCRMRYKILSFQKYELMRKFNFRKDDSKINLNL
jgi:hypothetical protein